MNSVRRYTWHHAPEEGQAAAEAGYPYGFGDNLTVFTGTERHAPVFPGAVGCRDFRSPLRFGDSNLTAALTAAILTTTLAIPAMATEAPDEPVRVSSYKGSTLEVWTRF